MFTAQSGELQENSVIRKFRNTAIDGKRYLAQFYNLDAIISVGYRVDSVRATHVLKEFTIIVDRIRQEIAKLISGRIRTAESGLQSNW